MLVDNESLKEIITQFLVPNDYQNDQKISKSSSDLKYLVVK